MDPTDVATALGARFAAGLDDYAATGDASALTCVLCGPRPCTCSAIRHNGVPDSGATGTATG
jgi:hypothetical protein